jgi:hypothetical protein
MGRYSDKNLVKYDETIQLHLIRPFEHAWLTLKNYGVVFHQFPWAKQDEPVKQEKTWDEVKEIAIGIPPKAGMPGTPFEHIGSGRLEIEHISIGSMLDVFQVIEFQVSILQATASTSFDYSVSGHGFRGQPWRYKGIRRLENPGPVELRLDVLLQEIQKRLARLGVKNAEGEFKFKDPWNVDIRRKLREILKDPPGALWIADQILINHLGAVRERQKDAAAPANTSAPVEEVVEEVHFTAYFPHPRFIIEEQRTELKEPKSPAPWGRTINSDSRSIEPIYSYPHTYPQEPTKKWKFKKSKKSERSKKPDRPFQQILDALDKAREENEQAFLAVDRNTEETDLLTRKQLAAGFREEADRLHRDVPRIDCYGFRGDTRDPSTIRHASGFLPQVTRKDKAAYKGMADRIDNALKNAHKDGGKEYRQVMMDLDIFTLGVYTADASFGGYISTTLSTAIAKHFASEYRPNDEGWPPVYCYSMRCKNALYLATEITGTWDRWKRRLHAPNALVHNAEQEVAVAGGIQWKDVVGARRIRVDPNGQKFCGPVFLDDLLRQEYQDSLDKVVTIHGKKVTLYLPEADDNAFDELFELFSGKNQGFEPTIYFSYFQIPFPCPRELVEKRNEAEKKALSHPRFQGEEMKNREERIGSGLER